MKNYTAEIIPYIPVTSWIDNVSVYYTKHIYRNSPYECADSCGTCDGGACEYCEKAVKHSIELYITSDEFRELLSKAFPKELDWGYCTLPCPPTINDVYDCFPELYRAIITYLNAPDLIGERKKFESSIKQTKLAKAKSITLADIKDGDVISGSLILGDILLEHPSTIVKQGCFIKISNISKELLCASIPPGWDFVYEFNGLYRTEYDIIKNKYGNVKAYYFD